MQSRTKILDDNLSLSDHLASQRTQLANERTLLAYVRTAFGFAAAGGTLCRLFAADLTMVVLGYFLMIIGASTLAAGIFSFRVNVSRCSKMQDCYSNKNNEPTV